MSDTRRVVTNYTAPHDEYLFVIYINTMTEYDSHSEFGMRDICNSVDVFFYDYLNSTFYVTDDNIEEFFTAYAKWHKEALKKVREEEKNDKIEELREQLAQLEAAEYR